VSCTSLFRGSSCKQLHCSDLATPPPEELYIDRGENVSYRSSRSLIFPFRLVSSSRAASPTHGLGKGDSRSAVYSIGSPLRTADLSPSQTASSRSLKSIFGKGKGKSCLPSSASLLSFSFHTLSLHSLSYAHTLNLCNSATTLMKLFSLALAALLALPFAVASPHSLHSALRVRQDTPSCPSECKEVILILVPLVLST
jgi:hypothetical protein